MQSRVLAWPCATKRLVVAALDVALSLVATWIAFSLRYSTLNWPTGAQWFVYGLGPGLGLLIFVKFGLYRAIFRYTGQAALMATAQAVGVYACLLTAVLLWQHWEGVPRTLGLLQPLIFLLLVGASRAWARFWLTNSRGAHHQSEGRLLIYGAGAAGGHTQSGLGGSGQFAVLGFVCV